MSARREVSLWIRREDGVEVFVQGRPVTIGGLVPGVVCHDPDTGIYAVVEPRSAHSMLAGKQPRTRAEAIRVATELVNRVGVESMVERIEAGVLARAAVTPPPKA